MAQGEDSGIGPSTQSAQADGMRGAFGGRAGGTAVGGPANGPAGNTRRRGAPRGLILAVLAIVVVVGGYVGYGYLRDQELYVSTDNALVTGSMTQVGSLNTGQVSSVGVDVGDRVARGQVVAKVMLPTSLGMTSGGTPKMGFRGTDDQLADVVSSVDGVVVARSANPGDTVAAGQSMLTVVDPSRLWVQAQIEETKVGRVHTGQEVEVTVDTLGQRLSGHVMAVGQATAATFSLLPQGNTSGNFTKVVQLVPVRIAVDYGQTPLVLGSSAEVKIRVQD